MEVWLARFSGVVVAISSGLFLLAIGLADPSDGANIGAGVALLSVLAGGVAVVLSLIAKHPSARPVRIPLLGVSMLALTIGAQGTFLVFFGVLEEIGQ